jgi:uncharacterized membrane protein YdbT with pleckstrin-like domain
MTDTIEIKKSERLMKFWWLISPIGILVVAVAVWGIWMEWNHSYSVRNFLMDRENTWVCLLVIVCGAAWAMLPKAIIWYLKRTSYWLTEYGIEKNWGLVALRTMTVPYKHVRMVTMVKRDVDRLTGSTTGLLQIECAGDARPDLVMRGIEDPHLIKQLIEERIHG